MSTETSTATARPKLLVIFNHSLTGEQRDDARQALGVEEIVLPPSEVCQAWAQIPADLPDLATYLTPIRAWLAETARPGDYVLVQGDFGATYLLVRFALAAGYVPIYSTTARQAREERLPGGEVRVSHDFRHRIYRRFGR